MSKINYTILKKEITRDPIELEYHNKTLEEIVAIMNDRQFSEAALYDENGAQIFYATGKTSTDLFMNKNDVSSVDVYPNQIKRSRAELLFGPDTVIEKEDIKLANLS
jgi:hypothetical protein